MLLCMQNIYQPLSRLRSNAWFTLFCILILNLPAQGQSSCFETRFSTENAQTGDTIAVEVSMRGFDDVISFQFAATWNPADLKFIKYNATGAPLSGQLFGTGSTSQGLFRALWSDANAVGVTVPNDAVFFKMYFKVLATTPGFYPVKISPEDNPTSYEVANNYSMRFPLSNVIGGARVNMPSDFAIEALCVNAPSCIGSNGHIQASVEGGIPPFHYNWAGPNGFSVADSVLNNLAQGYYALTITDAVGNVVEALTGFRQFGAGISASTVSTHDATCSLPNGCADLKVLGGTPPYQFAWSQPGPATEDRCDLYSGDIQVTITDAKGCVGLHSLHIWKDSLLYVDLDSLNADCRFDTKGGINLKTDGTNPLTYQWSNGATTQNLSNLSPGTYTVKAVDALGCIATKSILVRDYGTFDWTIYYSKDCITQYPPGTFLPITKANLKLQSYDFASRALFPLTISWSNGTRQNVQTLDDDVFVKDLGNQISVPNGRYAVTVTDAEGCSEVKEVLVDCPIPSTIEDQRPVFFIHDKETSGPYLDSCVEVSAYHSYHLMKVDFSIKWSEYYLNFKEIKIAYPAIKDSNFTFHTGSLDFHWESSNPYAFPNYFTIFKICFEKGAGSSNPDIEFAWGAKTPRILHETDGELGFIGKNGRVNFQPLNYYGSNFYDLNLLQPSCKTNGYARLELGDPLSWGYNYYQGITGSYNGKPFSGPKKLLFAAPGEYKVTQAGGSGIWSSLYAYIPPYSLPGSECVWPGDADKNSVVNHFDLLYLGLGMGSQSAPRSETDSLWQGANALDWPESTSRRHVNFKNLDLDGNGLVEPADTATLFHHWGQVIDPYSDQTPYEMPYPPDTLNPAMQVSVQADTLPAGAEVKIPLSFAADGIQGLAFSLSYDSVLVVSDARFEPSSSWLGDPLSDLICVQKDFQNQSRLDIAIARTDGQATSGAGAIGHLVLTFKTLPPDTWLRTVLFTAHALAITPAEKLIALGETREEIVLRGPINNASQSSFLPENAIVLSPNPTSENLLLQSNSLPIRRVEINSSDGSLHQVSDFANPVQQIQIGLGKMPAGTYFARIFCENGVVVKKFVVAR